MKVFQSKTRKLEKDLSTYTLLFKNYEASEPYHLKLGVNEVDIKTNIRIRQQEDINN